MLTLVHRRTELMQLLFEHGANVYKDMHLQQHQISCSGILLIRTYQWRIQDCHT